MFKQLKMSPRLLAWTAREQPIAFSNAENLYTDLILLRDEVIQMEGITNEIVKYLNNFIELFDGKLYKTVNDILVKWQEDGTLDDLISEALQWELDDFKATTEENFINLEKKLFNNASVSYRDFGAILDGVADDTLAIQEAHEYANEHGLKVYQNSGIIKLTDSVVVETPLDLTGCTLKLTDEVNHKTLFKVRSKHEAISVDSYNQSEFTKGAKRLPSLKNYKFMFIKIKSSEHFTNRKDGNTITPYKKEDSFVVDREGVIINGVLLHDFTNGFLEITAYPIDEELTVSLPKIEWNFSTNNHFATVFNVRHNNVVFKGGSISVKNDIFMTDPSSSYKEQIFYIMDSQRVIFGGLTGENMTRSGIASGYIINANHVNELMIERCTLVDGWGVTGTNYIRNFIVENSSINRLDVHLGTGDISCQNVVFVGGWGLVIGYGNGTVALDNVKFDFQEYSDNTNIRNLITLGAGYGHIYEGDIDITNVVVKTYDSNQVYDVLELDGWDYTNYNSDSNYVFKLPNLKVNSLTFYSNYSNQLIVYRVANLSRLQHDFTQNNRTLELPEYININNVYTMQEGISTNIKTIEILLNTSWLLQYLIDKTINITVKNIYETLNQGFEGGFTVSELTENAYPSSCIEIDLGRSWYNKIFLNINIYNVKGSVLVYGKIETIKIENSEIIFRLIVDTNNYPNNAILSNNKIYPVFVSTSNTYLYVDRIDFINNVFNSLTIDGVKSDIKELITLGGNHPYSAINNLFTSDSVVDSALVVKYFKYTNNIRYKNPNV